ncbi:MAG: VIT family protein [Dermatophilaceae bacterium]|nr:VIT family protein [Dermatophilaceae bacterium]
MTATPESFDHDEPHRAGMAGRLNRLRAGVLGANDGIVSTAGIVIGVAGATNQTVPIVTAGIAGLSAGAMSMAVGEFVSVSSQRDSERALLAKERRELRETPDEELAELVGMYAAKGLTPEVAQSVAEQLTAVDALAAHAEVELGIDPNALAHPGHAAWASFLSFVVGALLPLLAIAFAPTRIRVVFTVVAVALALMLTGVVSARLGQAHWLRPVLRNVLGGLLAMAVTYGIGTLVGRAI